MAHGVYIITKALNGFLMTQRQMTSKDVYVGMVESFIGHVCHTLSIADTADMTSSLVLLCNICVV